MFKRPLPRKKINPSTTQPVLPTRGVIYDILNVRDTPRPVIEKRFYYQNTELYLKLLEKNYKQANLPFRKPQVSEPPKRINKIHTIECHVGYPDRVVLKLHILKSGVVRVKLLASMACLWDKYYSKSKTPPLKSVISAYKNMGHSEAFIKKLHRNFERKKFMKERTQKIIESIFEKVPKKKVPTVPKKEVKKLEDPEDEICDEPPEEEEEDEDVQPEEDEGITEGIEEEEEEEEKNECIDPVEAD